jgi:hypothetical protein
MRRLFSGEAKGQAMIEFALATVIVGFAATVGTMLLGPTIKAHFLGMRPEDPTIQFGGMSMVINPTNAPTLSPTATSVFTATATLEPTATATATATAAPTFTSTPTMTPLPSPTATATPTYQQWCVAQGYTWKAWLQKCYNGWTYVPPPW